MIVKVVGIYNGTYKERMYDNVCEYVFTNSEERLAEEAFSDGVGNKPFSHITMIFSDKRDPISLSFNTKAFIMEQNGKTIDVLKHNADKERNGEM